ncbi:unnamed protein product [Brassica rapa subsp. trilocularis]
MKLCLMRFKVWMLSKRKIAEETEDLTSLKKTWRKKLGNIIILLMSIVLALSYRFLEDYVTGNE